MNVEAAVALATAAAGAAGSGAASAAGQSAWQTLVGLARRATGRADGTGDTATPAPAVDAADPDSVRHFTTLLRERALQDGDFAAQLCDWAERNRAVIEATQNVDQSPVHNTVSDTAQISGPLIQARDIHGDINLG